MGFGLFVTPAGRRQPFRPYSAYRRQRKTPHDAGEIVAARYNVTWSREFDEPILLPNGRSLVTLRDTEAHRTALRKYEAALPEWQAAIEALMLVVDLGGPTMFARIGFMRALNRGQVREFKQSGQQHHWGRRRLKRDR